MTIQRTVVVLVVLTALFAPMFTLAQATVPTQIVPDCTFTDPDTGNTVEGLCRFCDIFVVIHNIFNFLALLIAPLLTIVMFIIGGLLLMFGGGSPTLQTRGKAAVKGTLIGIIIILISWVVINSTINILASGSTQPEGFPWPWNEPACSNA